MLFGVIGIVYGAMLAFAQTDLKRLIAYTSVSHMGFVLLGVFLHFVNGHAGSSDANAYAWHQYRGFIRHGRNDKRKTAYKRHATWVLWGPPCR